MIWYNRYTFMEDEKKLKNARIYVLLRDIVLLLFVSVLISFLLTQISFYDKLIIFLLRHSGDAGFATKIGFVLGGIIFGLGLVLIFIRRYSQEHASLLVAAESSKKSMQIIASYKGEIEEQDQLFRSVSEHASDGILVINQIGKIVYWNKRAAEIFGYTRNDRQTIAVTDLMPQNSRKQLFERFTTFLTNSTFLPAAATEVTMLRKDQSLRSVEVSPALIRFKGMPHALVLVRDIEERKKLEAQSRELSQVINIGSLAMMITEPTGIIRYVNPAWEMLTGWSGSEVIGKSTPRILKSGKHGLEFYKNLWETITKGGRFQSEIINRRKDGAEFTIDQTINPIKDESGMITGYVAFLQDISRRKRMTHNLQERVKELNALYRLASMTQEAQIDYEIVLEQVPEIVKNAMRYNELAEVALVVRGKTYQTEHFALTPWKLQENLTSHQEDFGELTVVYTKEQPLIDVGPFFLEEKRLISGVASFLAHYIDHAEDEKNMQATALRLRGVLRSLSDTVLVSNIEGELENLLPNTNNTSVARNEPQTVRLLYGNETGDALIEFGKEALMKNNLVIREIEIKSEFGMRWFEARAYPLSNVTGSTKNFVLILRDIDDRKVSESRRVELERLKSQFLNTLTHSTRTPLTEIRWGIEGVLAGDYGEVSIGQQSHLRQLLQSEMRVLRLITNIELAIDIERGGVTPKMIPGSLVSLMTLVKKEFDRECSVRSIQCDLVMPKGELPAILFDRDLIRVVFEALFDNAVRLSKANSMMAVDFSFDEKFVRISVKDEGIGIPDEEKSYIFDRFYRATNAAIMYPDGVGLGLNISQQIAKLHGGLIQFESTLGEGSTFTLVLPRGGLVDK